MTNFLFTTDSQILGCAVYTGQDTKMALNSKLTSNKFSTVEKYANFIIAIELRFIQYFLLSYDPIGQ